MRFREIFEKSPIGIEIYDAAGFLIDANNACLEMFGVTDIADIKGFQIFDDPNLSPEAKEDIRKGKTVRLESAFEFGKIKECNLYPTSRTGTIYLDVLITPLPPANSDKSAGYLVQVQDISQRKTVQEALQRANDELESRVEAKTAELLIANGNLHNEIADRERTEQTLRESEKRFKAIFELAPLGIAVIDSYTGQFLQINEKYCEIVGRQQEEMLKSNFQAITHPDDLQTDLDQMARLRNGEIDSYRLEKRYSKPDGAIVWVTLTVVPMWEKEEKPVSHIAMVEDISEHKLAQDTLRRSEERYRMLLSSIPQRVFYKDLESRYVLVNNSYAQDFGVPPEYFVGKSDFDLYPFDLAVKYQKDDHRIMESKQTEEFDETYFQAEETKTVHTLKTPVLGENGQVVGMLGVFWDITERKRAEEERERLLKEVSDLAEVSRRRATELETTISSIVDAVFVCDIEGNIVDINKSGLDLLGLKRKDQIKLPIISYLRSLKLRHVNGQPIIQEDLALARALRGDVVHSYEEVARDIRSQREIYLLVSAAPIHDQKGMIVGAVEVIGDITRIRQLDKLKDEFITVAAHELKTPVAIMKGYAQALLRSSSELSPPSQKMLEAINRGSDRIDSVVKDLLDISRLYLGSLEMVMDRIDLTELADEVINRIAAKTARHHLRLLQREPVIVRGDRERLEQVLNNLIDNAIRYSPAGGDIDIDVITLNNEAIVSVADHGVGIPETKQEHIFERFYRAHTGTAYDYGGMGVGLYISSEIVQRHGGKIWFDSQEDTGSTFYFSLPLQGEQSVD